jgi:O-antigen ligase
MVKKGVNKGLVITSKPIWGILISASLITLYFNPSLEDPFNSPKLWILMISGSWLSGYLITNKTTPGSESKSVTKKINIIVFGFVLFLLISSLLTDIKYTAFFGEVQRRSGFLCYLFLSIFLLASARFFRINSINKLYYVTFFTGSILAIYGLLQNSGKDFIEWNNPYNNIIGTLGNPNFAAAIMAVMLVISFSIIFISGINRYFKLANFILVLFLIYTIYLSDARQGLVSLAIGVGFFILVLIVSLNKKIGLLSFLLAIFIAVLSIMGMLQMGPLKEYLYKSSVSVRGFYWRAGYQMFIDHPLTGVGIDRYGVYFKQYREVQYPLNYGFNLNSTNAHNVPIQFFATGGIFVGIFYLLSISFIFYRGIYAIRKFTGSERIKIAGIFSAWLTYQAQSIISIDNTGLSVWGWILGGIVIGLSTSEEPSDNSKYRSSHNITSKQVSLNLGQPVISGFLALLAIIISSMLYRGEDATFKARSIYPQNSQAVSQAMAAEVFDRTNKALRTPLIEPFYKLKLADYLFAYSKNTEAISVVDELLMSDPVNLDYLSVRAGIAENASDWNKAISIRNLIIKHDPWNAVNYYKLGLNYKKIEDFKNMNIALRKIISFAPNTAEAASAKLELVS